MSTHYAIEDHIYACVNKAGYVTRLKTTSLQGAADTLAKLEPFIRKLGLAAAGCVGARRPPLRAVGGRWCVESLCLAQHSDAGSDGHESPS